MCVDRFSLAADISEGYKGNRKYDLLPEVKCSDDVEKAAASVTEATTGSTPQPHDKPRELSKSHYHWFLICFFSPNFDNNQCMVLGLKSRQLPVVIAMRCNGSHLNSPLCLECPRAYNCVKRLI